MTDKMENSKIFLSESPNRVGSVIYNLQVPNFFTLPEYDNTSFKLDSPSFESADAKWCFRFSSSEQPTDGIKMFEVNLVRLNSEVSKHRVFYNTALLGGDNYEESDDGDNNSGGSEKDGSDNEEPDDDDDDNNQFGGMGIYEKDGAEQEIGFFANQKYSFDEDDSLIIIIHLICVNYVLGTDQVSLKRDRDFEILSQDFKKLFLNGKNHDLTLRVKSEDDRDDKEFQVHQNILMARSPVFEAMLSHDMTEKNEGVIDVPDCNPQAMEQFLLYVYSGKVEDLNQDNALGLYYAADKYQMLPLKEECTKFIKKSLSPSIICDVVQLALNHGDTDLQECATEYFVNHTSEIFPTAKWLSFMKSNTVAANELLIKTTKK